MNGLIRVYLGVSVVFLTATPILANAESKTLPRDLPAARSQDECRFALVESIPEGVTFNSSIINHLSTYAAWVELIEVAHKTIEIGSFYWNLKDGRSTDPKLAEQGQDIFNRLMDAGNKRKISVKIAQSASSPRFPNNDTVDLQQANAAEVRSVDFKRLRGAGVLHTKMWVVDRKHIYVGSANLDWKALTQVKELGFVVFNCVSLAEDLGKIFDAYWLLGEKDSTIPEEWPTEYATDYGKGNPLSMRLNGGAYNVYLTSSPPSICPTGRTTDLEAILGVIDDAKEFIHVAVMDYSPSLLYAHPPKFWPEIDNRLRHAALDRGVKVRLLVALWKHTKKTTFKFLKSLQDLNGVYPNVTIEVVPSSPAQELIPYARVNHNKYMVTEKTAYIGTSNWSGDYFTNTAGVGFVVTPRVSQPHDNSSSSVNDTESTPSTEESNETNNIRRDLADIFERDWSSSYSIPLDDVLKSKQLYDG